MRVHSRFTTRAVDSPSPAPLNKLFQNRKPLRSEHLYDRPSHSQYRHHRPRRPRQDHAGRRNAPPVRHLPLQRGRCRACHGLQRPRKRAWHHHPGEKHGHPVSRLQDQHRRYPRPRRLRRRSRARPQDGRRHPPAGRRLRRPAAPDALRALQGPRGQADADRRDQQDRSSRCPRPGGPERGL